MGYRRFREFLTSREKVPAKSRITNNSLGMAPCAPERIRGVPPRLWSLYILERAVASRRDAVKIARLFVRAEARTHMMKSLEILILCGCGLQPALGRGGTPRLLCDLRTCRDSGSDLHPAPFERLVQDNTGYERGAHVPHCEAGNHQHDIEVLFSAADIPGRDRQLRTGKE